VISKTGQSLPQHVLDSLERTRVGLKGPVTTPVAGGFASVNVALRKKLDLFANVRPVRSLPGIASRFSDVKIDMVIFRENTEDLYSGLEHEVVKGRRHQPQGDHNAWRRYELPNMLSRSRRKLVARE
jgi:isocitrate dehydrogenase (NAD+)